MTKILKQFTTTNKFVERDSLTFSSQIMMDNENYQNLVYTTATTQNKAKAYYVQITLPYNLYIPTAYIFKIRDTNSGVENVNKLDFINDTHQVIKYSEAPYNGGTVPQQVDVLTVGYTVNNIQLYQAFTYDQTQRMQNTSFSKEDFNNISSTVQDVIQFYIQSFFINEESISNFKFNIQKLDTSNINGAERYITFDFIFISKISWNQFICCYDRNAHDNYIIGGRVLNKDDTNINLKIYPFIENSDLIERSENFGENRIFHNSLGEINKITVKVYNDTVALDNIPFYINSQNIKIGPSKQYTLENANIYNFGIPNIDENLCVIEYEYEDE